MCILFINFLSLIIYLEVSQKYFELNNNMAQNDSKDHTVFLNNICKSSGAFLT